MAISTTSSSTSSSTGLQMPGLATGLDTESIIKQLSSASKIRINRQQQKMDSLQWKQESYRSVISKITTFKETYFNMLKPATNLASSSLFGKRTAASTDSSLKVTASSNAVETTYNITNIQQKAEKASIQSTSKVVDGIKLDINAVNGTEYKIKFNLDGLTKEVTFLGGTTGTGAGSTQDNLLTAINTAFSATGVTFSATDNIIKATDATNPNLIHTFSISQVSGNDGLSALGFSETIKSTISNSTKLEDLAFSTSLEGNSFTFEINGESFAFDKSQTVTTVLSKINSSNAGVKMSFDSIGGKFKIESTDAGIASSLSINQTSGNLLTAMFGDANIQKSTTLSSGFLMEDSLTGITPAEGDGFGFTDGVSGDIEVLKNTMIKVTLNGVEKNIGLWSYNSAGVKNDFSTSEAVVTQLNQELSKVFSTNAPTISYDEDAKTFTIKTATFGDEITVGTDDENAEGSLKLLTALGFNDTNNTNSSSETKLLGATSGSISFGPGFTVNLDATTTIKDLVDGSNGLVTYENGIVKLSGVDWNNTDTDGRAYLTSLFGDATFPDVSAAQAVTSYTSQGKNAIVTVNGNTITTQTNSVTIDGTTMDISALSTGAVDITVTTSKDTSQAFDAIKSFVADYNTLIEELYETVNQKHDSDYPPLTEEQREEMSETEIENWEKKAKEGLLYQDSTISRFLTTLRSSVSGFSSNGMTVANLGISVSAVITDYGKLELDETSLQKALDSNAENILKFFTDSEKGFAAGVTKAINNAVGTTGSSKGTLVILAGIANTSTAVNNSISRQLEQYQDLIDTLQSRYEDEQDRYWASFTNLETVISSYNTQSSWLTSQLSS